MAERLSRGHVHRPQYVTFWHGTVTDAERRRHANNTDDRWFSSRDVYTESAKERARRGKSFKRTVACALEKNYTPAAS
jgi:hypothetical protein